MTKTWKKITFFLCSLSVWTQQCFQKKCFFAHKKLKKPPSKVAHNRPQNFFFMYWPGCPNQPRIDFSCHKYVPRRICSLICGANRLFVDKVFNYLFSFAMQLCWHGGIQQLRGQNFAIFWPPPPCLDSFYTLSVEKNRHFLTPSPQLFHVLSYWMAPIA